MYIGGDGGVRQKKREKKKKERRKDSHFLRCLIAARRSYNIVGLSNL
jgi:hypothetical protein